MENEKIFTFDVKRISNGFLIFHDGKEVYREASIQVNGYIEGELRSGVMAHIIDCYPKGTAQRLVVTMSIFGKAME